MKTVLVLDDEQGVLESLGNVLRQYTVIEATK
jgi:hypothetical protein